MISCSSPLCDNHPKMSIMAWGPEAQRTLLTRVCTGVVGKRVEDVRILSFSPAMLVVGCFRVDNVDVDSVVVVVLVLPETKYLQLILLFDVNYLLKSLYYYQMRKGDI